MDEIVRQAMARWPNVPHCFGWLRLDARGGWRMRDERAQRLDLPGERIVHPALLAFIERNYSHDQQGRWYFQNGPQRVYVDLELTPYIARTQPAAQAGLELLLHTGERMSGIAAAWLDENGRLYLKTEEKLAAVDDRDMAHLLPSLQVDGKPGDEALLRWMEGDDSIDVRFVFGAQTLTLARIPADQLERDFGFVALPRAP